MKLLPDLRPHVVALFAVGALAASVACGNSPAGPGGTGGSNSCQIITGVTTTSFPAAGGSASITVNAAAGCAWTATSNAAFLTVTSGASGTADGVVQFSVAANAGAARSAILTITGTPITISQTGAGQ